MSRIKYTRQLQSYAMQTMIREKIQHQRGDYIEAKPVRMDKESVHDFIKRGGTIIKAKYRKPHPTLATFNGGTPMKRAR